MSEDGEAIDRLLGEAADSVVRGWESLLFKEEDDPSGDIRWGKKDMLLRKWMEANEPEEEEKIMVSN